MDPNSQHQIWSLWTLTATPGQRRAIPFEQVRQNCAKFGRRQFGAASQMKVEYRASGQWVIMVRTEGHPVHDPRFVEIMREQWEQYLTLGFGVGTKVELQTKLEAGSRDDGRPAEQLIIIPPLKIGDVQ